LEEAGVEVTPANKKEIDRAIQSLVEVEYKDCSPAWKEIKTHIKGDDLARLRFIDKLKQKIKTV
jgi:hypothetical protein